LAPRGDKEQLPENPRTPRIIELSRTENKELPAEPMSEFNVKEEKELPEEPRQSQESRALDEKEQSAEPVPVHQEENETPTKPTAQQASEGKELRTEPASTNSPAVNIHKEKETLSEVPVLAGPELTPQLVSPEYYSGPAPKPITMEAPPKAKPEPEIPPGKVENVDPKTPISPTKIELPRPKVTSPAKRFPVATSREIPGSPSRQRPGSPSKLPPGSPSKQAPGSPAKTPAAAAPSPQKSAFAARRAMFEQQK
jgi:hypothetical protein